MMTEEFSPPGGLQKFLMIPPLGRPVGPSKENPEAEVNRLLSVEQLGKGLLLEDEANLIRVHGGTFPVVEVILQVSVSYAEL